MVTIVTPWHPKKNSYVYKRQVTYLFRFICRCENEIQSKEDRTKADDTEVHQYRASFKSHSHRLAGKFWTETDLR